MTEAYSTTHPTEVFTASFLYEQLLTQKDTLLFAPGTKGQYNNLNYFLLAQLIQRVSGISFSAYMDKHIFSPAKMTHTFIRTYGSSNPPRYMLPMYFDDTYVNVDSIPANRPVWTYRNLGDIPGSSNVVSTIEDLVRFDQALWQGRLLPIALLQEAMTPTLLQNGKPYSLGPARSYGLGWNIVQPPGKDSVVFHDGSLPGLNTLYLHNLNKHQSIIAYDNTASWGFLVKVNNVNRVLNNEALTVVPVKRSIVREYGPLLLSKGKDYALLHLQTRRIDTAHYYLDELQLNTLGIDLMLDTTVANHMDLALEVLRLNTVLYRSANTFDTYGDALKKAGKKEEAIMAFQRSLELNPNNENAKKNLAALRVRD